MGDAKRWPILAYIATGMLTGAGAYYFGGGFITLNWNWHVTEWSEGSRTALLYFAAVGGFVSAWWRIRP